MKSVQHFKDQMLMHDLANMLCGKLLGQSMKRKVFDCQLMSGYVVKIEDDPSSHRNIMEFAVWESVMYTEQSKWFAHIKSMSAGGRILLMEKTRPPMEHEWPDKIPAYMTDLKRENFGISLLTDPKTGKVSNRFVAHDYSHHLLLEKGHTKRMQKVDWSKYD